MKRLFLSVAIVASLTLTHSVKAADKSDVLTLTVAEAVKIALSDNPTIQIAELEVERYDYVRKTTFGSLLPQVSVDGTFNQTLKNQSMAEGFTLGANQYSTMSASGNISLAIYSPSVYRTLKMNATEMESAIESARSSKIDLIAAVKNSFYNIMLAERSLEVLESSAETAKQTVDETQLKFDNELSSEYDLLTAQVQYSNLQPSIMQTRASIEIAKDLLKMYLSLPESVKIEVEGDFDQIKELILSVEPTYRDLSGNSSLRSLALSQEVLEHQLRINNATRLPTLAAYGQVTYTGNNMGSFSFSDTGEIVSSATNGFFWQSPASVGLSLSVPIFSGWSNTSRSRQIKNQISQMELQRRYTEDNVNLSLTTAISDIYTARETLFAQQQTVDQASKAYKISETRYNSEMGTILELNTSRLTLTQAELNLSQAIYDLLVAKSEYDRILGIESIE